MGRETLAKQSTTVRYPPDARLGQVMADKHEDGHTLYNVIADVVALLNTLEVNQTHIVVSSSGGIHCLGTGGYASEARGIPDSSRDMGWIYLLSKGVLADRLYLSLKPGLLRAITRIVEPPLDIAFSCPGGHDNLFTFESLVN